MIPIIRPWLDAGEEEAAVRVLRSGWITQGEEVAAFEREFAAFTNAPHAIAVSSCTSALHLALLAAGVLPGDEVVTVSHSFIATANSIRYCGADPVFVDICPDTYNMDPSRLESAFSPRTRAILCVHQLGMPCDLSAIGEIARRRGVPLIEDAACAIGSEIRMDGVWQKIGKPHGDFACFSFHPRKILTTGDGGMITCTDSHQAARLRRLRQHAMSVADTVRHRANEIIFETYDELGFNYRMTDIQAAIGREQLKKLPQIVQRRRELARNYQHLLAGISGLRTPHEPEWVRSNFQSYCVRLPPDCNQKGVQQVLLDNGVASRRGVMCAHREEHYRALAPEFSLTYSEQVQDQTIILPLYHDMERTEQEHVAMVVRQACAVEMDWGL
ncbi:MAG: Glutamine--scyllo-inositol transaminase [Magnetococcales bacterium]|nr:Glutamine--scyllo-inositol transaminase [Magnetococcales bacterium]